VRSLLSALAFAGLAGVFAQLGDVPVLRVEPQSIVWIDAGQFVMGASEPEIAYAIDLCMQERTLVPGLGPDMDGSCSAARFLFEAPERAVWTERYGIDRTEVTHAAWRRCVIYGRCAPSRIADDDARLARPDMPVTGVTFDEASAYCRFAGGRLPSHEEWERAARRDRRHRFPWGRVYSSSLANHGRAPSGPDASDGYALAAPVGSYPGAASPYGLLDMAGNVWEWTASSPLEVHVGPGADPSVYRIIRGGSWAQPAVALRVTSLAWVAVSEERSDLGLRCAYDR
jgi:sulfatase modifying factor 1